MVIEPKEQMLIQRCRTGMGAPHSKRKPVTKPGLITERPEQSSRSPKKTMSQRRKGKATVTVSC